jgi:ankyrin repeat protein
MSALKDKGKKRHGASSLADENGDKVAKRKSKRMSKKEAKIMAPKELVSAIKEGNLELIKRYMAQNTELRRSLVDVESGQTLFHCAIRSAQLEVVEALISAGVSTGDVDLKMKNALHHLARVKDASKALVDLVVALESVNKSAKDSSGATPLHLAIRYKNLTLATTLISSLHSTTHSNLIRMFQISRPQ